MSNKLLVVCVLALLAAMPGVASASARNDDVQRLERSARVFHEIMSTPDSGIPQSLLDSAKCVAIIPGDTKFAFILGGDYGRGVAVCHTRSGWSAPLFLTVEGGSIGYQIGGSSTDLVLLFMNDHALHSLLSDRFKLGADASVAAGPVGRMAAAGTDAKLSAEILSYSRAKGIFAGVSLDGTVVHADKGADEAMYGPEVNRHAILSGSLPAPESAAPLRRELAQYTK